MSPSDHNKTLALLYSLLGGFSTLPLLASPLIIATSVDSFPSPRREGQIIVAAASFCLVLFIALLFYSTAAGLYRRKPSGRKLGMVVAVLLLPFCPPIAAYTWWFLHSEGGKELYGDEEQ